MFLYNRWANLRLLEACQSLTAGELQFSGSGGYGTIYDTLVHILRAEAGYARLLTGERPSAPFDWDARPGLEQMRDYAARVGDALIEAAANVGPDSVVEVEWDGKPVKYLAVTVLIQSIQHGIEHRTNITTIMAAQGITAPDIDGWGYMGANRHRLGISPREEGRNEN
jgi:uncharacterized damage-inducible protein DinB